MVRALCLLLVALLSASCVSAADPPVDDNEKVTLPQIAEGPIYSFGSGSDISALNSTVTIYGITKPANTIIVVALMCGYATGSLGANSSSATFAGVGLSWSLSASATNGGNTYLRAYGFTNNSTALTGDIVITFTGVVPDCKAVQYWIINGTGFDAFATGSTASSAASFSFTTSGTIPGVPPEPCIAIQWGAGGAANFNGTWTGPFIDGPASTSGGSVPVTIDWSYYNSPVAPVTYGRTGYSTPLFWSGLFCVGFV